MIRLAARVQPGRVAADLERAEVFVPITRWYFGLGVDLEAKLVEIGDAGRPVAHPVDQVLANACGEVIPALDLGH